VQENKLILKLIIISISCLLLFSQYYGFTSNSDDASFAKDSSVENEAEVVNLENIKYSSLDNNPQKPITTTTRTARADMDESEGNDEFSSADRILDTPITVTGQLSELGDVDCFKIALEGEANPVDNLTILFTYIETDDSIGGAYYHELFISIWGAFEEDYLLMQAASCQPYYWNSEEDCPPLHAHAYDSGYYYIRIFFTNRYGYNNAVDYEFEVTLGEEYTEDNNQVIELAKKIDGPRFDERVDMGTDMFDWYYIDSPDPENYSTNFSISVDITASLDMKQVYTGSMTIYFVTEVHLLIYHQKYIGKYEGDEIVGNMYHKFDQDDPIVYYQWTPKETTYIGIYVQTLGWTNDREGGYIAGDGYCNGWAEYSIEKIVAKPMIPPVLSNASVKLPIGKIYHTYEYKVTYSDANNDPPQKITVTIDGRFGPEEMVKLDETDKNYEDGCIYIYRVDGTTYKTDTEEHTFWIWAEDIERSAQGWNGIGPIITENTLPNIRPSSEKLYSLYEDDPISYFDLNSTFEDADNDTLYYRLSNDNQDWSNVYNSENITIKVVIIEDQKYLEFKPLKNRFNRYPGESSGSEIVYINVSDQNADQPGGISRAHYMAEPFELELIIISINDPPRIKTAFESQYFEYEGGLTFGEMLILEDQIYKGFDLNLVFHDPVENDPLLFSLRELKNIDIRFYSNGTADFIPNENWTGTESLEIIANDGYDSIWDSIKVTVVPVNDNPVLNYTPKQVILEDQWCNLTFSGYDTADNEQVFFETNLKEILELPSDRFSFDSLTGKLSFKPENKNVGTHKDIIVTIKDYRGGATSQNVVFEIVNSPDPPEPKIITPQNGDRFLVTERIEFQGEYYDPDDTIQIEEHSYQWYSTIDGNLSVSPNFKTELPEGEHHITFEVTDPFFTESKTILILVLVESELDTDHDGIPDYWEKLHMLNHFDPQDAENDPDKDSYTNLEEYLGMDGKVGGYDDTDPRDPSDHPDEHYETIEEEASSNLEITVGAIIIIVVILLLLFIIIRRKRQKFEEEEDSSKPEEEMLWQDMYGRKYEVYKYEPNQIMCHNCLEKIDIQIPIRPLVVTCPKCNTRGVLYK